MFDRLSAAAESDSDDVESLPPHKLYGNHTLNLVASCDSLHARKTSHTRDDRDRAMAKVQALSNAVNQSPKMNDIVEWRILQALPSSIY